MKLRYVIVCLFLCCHPLFSQEIRIPVAVLNFETAGIDSSSSITFTNRLRAELLKTGVFDVMERERMEEILTEQGFQQAGICNSDECIVQAGRILEVNRMIGGSIGKVGELYTIAVRLIDIETARILFMASEDAPGSIETLLTVSMQNIAQKLSTRAIIDARKLSAYGMLKLISTPPGARIIIDDRSLSGLTPLLVDSVEVGVHIIRLQKELLAASKAVFVAPEELTEVNLELTPSKGSLKLIVEPSGAEIFLDHHPAGSAPKIIRDLPVGSYYLQLAKEGYVEHAQILSIREDETTVISAKLVRMSFLSLTSNPMDCQVFVDDSLIGSAPLTSHPLKPGFHKISVRKKGFVSFEETRSLPAGELTTLDVILDAMALLSITSDPREAELYIDGIYRGLTPLEVTDLKPGAAQVKLKKDLHEDQLLTVVLEKGLRKEINLAMVKKRGRLIVQSIPPNAGIEIDGVHRGNTPLEINDVEYGHHLLRLTLHGYRDIEQNLDIREAFARTIQVNFEIAPGKLFLSPSPRDALLLVNGKKLTEIPATGIDLMPGTHRIHALRPGYEEFSGQVILRSNDAVSLKISLAEKTREQAMLRSLLFPGLGQHYAEKRTRQYLFSITEMLSLASVFVADLSYDRRISAYESKRRQYGDAIDPADIDRLRKRMIDSHDDVRSAKNLRQKLVVTAAGIWLLNIFDAAIFGPIRPDIVPGDEGMKLSVNYAF